MSGLAPNPTLKPGSPACLVTSYKESEPCQCNAGWSYTLSEDGNWIVGVCLRCGAYYLPGGEK